MYGAKDYIWELVLVVKECLQQVSFQLFDFTQLRSDTQCLHNAQEQTEQRRKHLKQTAVITQEQKHHNQPLPNLITHNLTVS